MYAKNKLPALFVLKVSKECKIKRWNQWVNVQNWVFVCVWHWTVDYCWHFTHAVAMLLMPTALSKLNYQANNYCLTPWSTVSSLAYFQKFLGTFIYCKLNLMNCVIYVVISCMQVHKLDDVEVIYRNVFEIPYLFLNIIICS